MSARRMVRYEVDGAVARIVMDRPEKRNAECVQLIEERHAAFCRADGDPDIRVVVLAATGPSVSAGHDTAELAGDADVAEMRSSTSGTFAFERRLYFDTALRIERMTKPTIAAVQGACVAGGLMTAAMCDLIVASADARFQEPVAGFLPFQDGERAGSVSLEVFCLPWQVGIRRAKEIMFAGEWFDARQAMEWGLVNRVVPRDQLHDEAMALAHRVAQANASALALLKRSFAHAQELMGMTASYEYHFLLHQLRHGGLDGAWLRPADEPRRGVDDAGG